MNQGTRVMLKIIAVFGTRPEAIKMCPLINELKSRGTFDVRVCVTGQHREMLYQVLRIFNIIPDYDLDIMKNGQDLFYITSSILSNIKQVLEKEKPDLVMIHGDTTTTVAAALASFYLQIPIAHIEAGLRTYNISEPFPEEANRQIVSILAQYNFAPTEQAKQNLLNEGKKYDNIFITGNTGIDALATTISKNYHSNELEWAKGNRLILVTTHRRENLGEPMRKIFRAIRQIVDEYKDVRILFPIHLNPEIRKIADEILGRNSQIHLVAPLEIMDFHNIMKRSYFILTDSGGIQEEAAALKKPVLVTRNITERLEGVVSGNLKLVGTDEKVIYNNMKKLLDNEKEYDEMCNGINPYGDGYASKKIADILETIYRK